MSKKIIALALVIVFIATAFTACKQKYETIEINGKEYALATDDEGNTIVNDNYQIIVLVTDDRGRVVTDVNGDNVTNVANLWGSALNNGKTYGEYSSLAIPEGWESDEDGNLIKTGTDGKCNIKCVKAGTLDEENTFEEYLVTMEDMNKRVHDSLTEQGFTVESNKSSENIDGRESVWYSYKVIAKDGTVAQYVEYCYFVFNNIVYNVKYTCTNGEGYDSTFDFKGYLGVGFDFIEPGAKAENESSTEAETK